MEQGHMCCLISKQDLLGLYKTIYLCLENQNFHNTCKTFKQECSLFGCKLPTITGTVKIIRRTERFDAIDEIQNELFVLESSFCELKSKNTSEKLIKSDLPQNSFTNLPSPLNHCEEFIKLKESFHNLREEHKKLIAVTTELTGALQCNIMGQTKNYHTVLDDCKSIYPALFQSKVPEIEITDNSNENERKDGENSNVFIKICTDTVNLNDCGDKSLVVSSPSKDIVKPEVMPRVRTSEKDVGNILDSLLTTVTQSSREEIGQQSSKNEILIADYQSPKMSLDDEISSVDKQSCGIFPLDFVKIKKDLFEAKIELRLALLQALRWRVTKSSGPVVNSILIDYISNDILNLTKSESLPETYLKNISNTPENLLECFSRLLNTFASFKIGRDYLSNYKHTLDVLLQLKFLNNKEICSSFTRDMLIASVQKLSLRKPVRKRILALGSLDELLEFLNQSHNKVSDYCLEYSTALLMNLSLEDEARTIFANEASLLVNLLKKLLNGMECCLPYVNGTLYSVLVDEEIKKVAKDLDLDKTILFKIESLEDLNLRKQLEIVINTRFNEEIDPFEGDSEITEEVDLLESELDECDIIISNIDSGEKLLEQYKTNRKVYTKSLDLNDMKHFCRPVTPAALKNGRKSTNSSTISNEQQSKTELANGGNLFLEKNTDWKTAHELNLNEFPDQTSSYAGDSNYQKLDKLFKAPYSSTAKYKVNNLHKKRLLKNRNLYATSMCYMDAPFKTKKLGQSRYSCSCYETIKQDVETDEENQNYNNNVKKSKFSQFFNIPERIFVNSSNSPTVCSNCKDQCCECAFEPRPKLIRTPPERP